jgi:hypothetical protein
MNKDFRRTFLDESVEHIMEELSPLGFIHGMEEDKEWELV